MSLTQTVEGICKWGHKLRW